ncbi:MAG: penicillin-binding protein 2 [Mailhella sp.]|nr:penicillin-binding protein 2 [Mailhella sp.]
MVSGQYVKKEPTQGLRGSILDRNGITLARSVACQSVWMSLKKIDDIDDAVKKLAPLIHKTPQALKSEIENKRGRRRVAIQVDDATAASIQALKINGIELETYYKRVYPYRHIAGQLIGFVGRDGHGQEGIERSFDSVMQGESVTQQIPTIAALQILNEGLPSPDDLRGRDVRLTIDLQVQYMAEEALQNAVKGSGAKWGGVLVSDVATGEVLAWAQCPFFNPNNSGLSNAAIYRNRLAADSLEPGSTFKPLLMAAALEEKVISPESSIYCEKGLWRTKYANIRDDTHSFGYLTATEIIAHSSNIGSAKIGLKLGTQKYYSYLTKLGFGSRTGIGVNGESRGILRAPKNWSELDLMSTAFGQSVSVTGVQMLQSYTTLASGGELRPVKIVLDEESSSGLTHPETRVFSERAARAVVKMMEETVDGNGTGSKARIPGVRVAGKTGTAQKAGPRGRGYSTKRVASFGGIVPADDPKFVIYVLLDEPSTTGYGGAIAAPVFQKVASSLLAYSGYLPDVTFSTQLPKTKPLTAAQKARQEKDAAYLESIARYREQKAAKERKAGKIPAKDTPLSSMPDLAGMSLRKAMEVCARHGVVPELQGDGAFVSKPSPPPPTPSSR